MIRAFASLSLAAMTLAAPAHALETLSSPHSVADTMDKLVAAVEGAGAQVVARVNHAASAEDVDMTLPEAQLLVFGNPAIGTPIMQGDLRAGVMLPMRVLVHEGEGGTAITWQTPEEMFAGLDVDLDSEPVQKMQAALSRLTAKAAE